jgi:hypothetical protein
MRMRRLAIASFVLVACAAIASAEPRPRTGTDEFADDPTFVPPQGLPLASTNKIFLNRCPNGCVINVGQSNSINNTWQVGQQRLLTKFPWDDATWTKVVSCVNDVFEPYNLVITEIDPGTASHFEISK